MEWINEHIAIISATAAGLTAVMVPVVRIGKKFNEFMPEDQIREQYMSKNDHELRDNRVLDRLDSMERSLNTRIDDQKIILNLVLENQMENE